MVPIHDTDVASERWAQEEWENYELWEKVEVRLKRQRRMWIFATAVVFVFLSALPIVMDRWPKWSARVVLRHLAHELSRIKREAGVNRAALRLRVLDPNRLTYQIEKIPNCKSREAGEILRTGTFESTAQTGSFRLLSSQLGSELGIPGLQESFCYDHLEGFSAASDGKQVVGFGVISSRDFDQKRLDRISILLLSGPSAEVSMD